GQPENEQAEPWTEGASERTSARVDPRPQNARTEQEPEAGGQEAGAYRRKGTAEAEMAQGERGNNFDQAHTSQGQLPRAVVDQREPQGRPLAEHGGGDRDRESGERRRSVGLQIRRPRHLEGAEASSVHQDPEVRGHITGRGRRGREPRAPA